MNSLALIKIGGSLITDKTKPLTTRQDMMLSAADEISAAFEKNPEMSFIIANGAGSFGHYLASQEAGANPRDRIGAIHESVVLLNKIFVEYLIKKGLSAVSVVPAATITAEDGALKDFDLQPIEDLLSINSMPVLFGDIVDDGSDKGMIFSTEALFEIIAEKLCSEFDIHVVYVGETDGVFDKTGAVIPEISSTSWRNMGSVIEATKGYDVTGGMLHKVESALRIARVAKSVHIISGKIPGAIAEVLAGKNIGTRVVP